MSGAQPSIHSPGLSIHIARLIAPQEQHHTRHLIRASTPLHRIQLPNLLLAASRARSLVHGGGHARLDDAGADGIDADAGAGELEGDCLGEGDDAGLGGRVGGAAGVGAEAGDGGGADDAAAGSGLLGGRLCHGWGGVFGGEEYAVGSDLVIFA